MNANESVQEIQETTITMNDLPDEILENIFSRLSPYRDLDSVSIVCLRWNRIAKITIQSLKSNFHESILNGKLECLVKPTAGENFRTVSGWPQERYGQTACYYDKSLYIIGGSTHRNTTFNDMWKFDLGTQIWSRVVTHGSYPSPKALASCVRHKDNIYIYGGWTHPSSSPFMVLWRLFDELHRYNVTTNTWTFIVDTTSPPPMAGHSCSTFGDEMIIFGGRTYDHENQRYPVSNDVWIFDFTVEEWCSVTIERNKNSSAPAPRYGQTQVAIDESHVLIIGGCEGPSQVFKDIWLLNIRTDAQRRKFGFWKKLAIADCEGTQPTTDFHYSGCRVGDAVVFLEQCSSISPYLAFLHFDCQNLPPLYQHGIVFEPSREPFQHRRRQFESSLKTTSFSPTMSVYSLDISRVLVDHTVKWTKEIVTSWLRPDERFLYSIIAGRSELILFGGFFKEPNGRRCRVSNDVFILRTVPKTY